MRCLLTLLLSAAALFGQASPRMVFPPPDEAKPQAQPPKPTPTPATPGAVSPAPATQPQAGAPAEPRLAAEQTFSLGGVSLNELIQVLGKQLKINFIVDPRVKGSVT